MSFYNTNRLSAEALKTAVASAKALDVAVETLFGATGGRHSPSQICTSINAARKTEGKTEYPITSVRRAITDLTEAGKLEKLDETVPGPLGRPEGLWRVATAKAQAA